MDNTFSLFFIKFYFYLNSKRVIIAIERNYDNILSINANADIYTLGAYIPKSLRSKEMDIFRDLVISYNEKLLDLCKQYGVTLIDTEEVGKNYNNSERNFHISTAGHNALANYILGYMYQNKIGSQKKHTHLNNDIFEISNKGSQGMIDSISLCYEESYKKAMELSGYPRERELAIADEHRREKEVFQKVLVKKK